MGIITRIRRILGMEENQKDLDLKKEYAETKTATQANPTSHSREQPKYVPQSSHQSPRPSSSSSSSRMSSSRSSSSGISVSSDDDDSYRRSSSSYTPSFDSSSWASSSWDSGSSSCDSGSSSCDSGSSCGCD